MKGRLFIVKKIYEEPMIVVELYALTQNIAACDAMSDDLRSLILHLQEVEKLTGADLDAAIAANGYDLLCYHTNANSTFGS